MIIDIEEELFQQVKKIVKSRSLSVYKQLEELKPIDALATDTTLISFPFGVVLLK